MVDFHLKSILCPPNIPKVPPISERGNVIEIAGYFGGAEKLREAVNELQTLLYAG